VSTLYRAVFSDDRSDIVVGARGLFQSWLAGKGIKLEVPASGRAEIDNGRAIEVIAAEDGDVEAARLRLDEEASGCRWSTIVTVMASGGEGWVWIDLERVSDEAYGPPPVLAPPGIVRAFLESSTCRAGSTPLRARHRVVDEGGVDELVTELLDPGRAVPIVVASRDSANPPAASARAGALASALVGVANVWALDGVATSALSKELGPDLHVYAGAVRTYFPDVTVPDRYPQRHRFARRELFIPHPRHGAQVVARAIVAKATGQRPPLLFRNRVTLMPGFTRQGRDAEQLLVELVAAEEDRDRLQKDLDWQILETEDAAARVESALNRVKWLERRAVQAGDYVVGLETPAPDIPTAASDCVEALELAKAHLALLEVGDTIEVAAELDQNPKAGTWGRKAWQALRALQSYAEAKATGAFAGNFFLFCMAPLPGSDVIRVRLS